MSNLLDRKSINLLLLALFRNFIKKDFLAEVKKGMMLISIQTEFYYTLMFYRKLIIHAAFSAIWIGIKLQRFCRLLDNFPRILNMFFFGMGLTDAHSQHNLVV